VIRGVLNLIYASKFGEAERVLADADKKWPRPRPHRGALRSGVPHGQIEAAQAQCTQALAADPSDSWALYLLESCSSAIQAPHPPASRS